MAKLKYIFIIILVFLFGTKTIFAYQKVSSDEYKEFLRGFIEKKYYVNVDGGDTCTFGKIDAECSGVTVTSTGKTYDLDTYVAGVISAEPSYTIDGNDELGKAWAIIIRSYTLAHTNNCKNSITASSNEQNFSSSDQSTYKKYADETSGIVMTDNNEIVEAVYSLATSSDCIITEDNKCKFKRCTKYSTSMNSCPGQKTEFIVPFGTITYTDYDIHYGGIEPFLARYLAKNENYTYDKLLKAFYGDNIQLSKITSSGNTSSGDTKSQTSSNETFSCNDDTGDMTTVDGVSFPVKNYDNIHQSMDISVLENNQYFANAGSNISQCPWYAKARAIEIINTSTLSTEQKEKATAVLKQTFGNGVDWYGGVNSTLGSYFAYSSDINKPKAGSIIAWSGGRGHNYGHVGIIEKVNDDGTVVLSDGWNKGGPEASDTWDNIAVETITISIDDLKYLSGHTFEGYTYLFSYRK